MCYGAKKPKLEQVTLQQWVVSNTRIFYNLLASRKFQSHEDIQHYLAYTIKIMELAYRFQLVSVLKYDDEFRLLQATYNYPWSFDSNNLHTVLLAAYSQTATNASQWHNSLLFFKFHFRHVAMAICHCYATFSLPSGFHLTSLLLIG